MLSVVMGRPRRKELFILLDGIIKIFTSNVWHLKWEEDTEGLCSLLGEGRKALWLHLEIQLTERITALRKTGGGKQKAENYNSNGHLGWVHYHSGTTLSDSFTVLWNECCQPHFKVVDDRVPCCTGTSSAWDLNVGATPECLLCNPCSMWGWERKSACCGKFDARDDRNLVSCFTWKNNFHMDDFSVQNNI